MNWNWFRSKPSPEVSDRNAELSVIKDYLNEKYGHYDYTKDSRSLDIENEFKAIITSLIAKMQNDNPGTRLSVLITGANSGVEVELFSDFDITALDLSDVALRELSRKYPHVTVIQGDIQKLPFADKTFDLYVSMRAIHCQNIGMPEALRESIRVAKSYLIY